MNKIYSIKPLVFILIICNIFLYVYIAYFIKRSDFFIYLLIYSFLFICFWCFVKLDFNHKFLFGILLRLLMLFSLPTLSQDYFRFIWDGRLLANGINPFLYLPHNLLNDTSYIISQKSELVMGMGTLSASNYSNYPPINQLIFFITGLLSDNNILGSVILMRIFIIFADIGIFIYGVKLLAFLKLPSNNINIYFLNPLIIIELTGNLHFEGVMMFFLSISLLLLFKNNYLKSSIFMAMAVLTKVVPILIIPVVIKYIGFKKSFLYVLSLGFVCLLVFLPFMSKEFFFNYSNTLGLWFSKFEFNASIYYLLRALGTWAAGYNMIFILGKISLLSIFIANAYLIYRHPVLEDKKLISSILFVLTIYFFFSTTIHPWYLVSLVFIAVFSEFKYPLIWSFTVVLSYYAYSFDYFKENPIALLIEYIPIYYVFYLEIRRFIIK